MDAMKNAPGLAPGGVEKEAWVNDFNNLNNGHPLVSQAVFAWLWRNSDRFIPRNAKWYSFKVERKVAAWHSVEYTKHKIAYNAAANHAHFFSIHGFGDKPLPVSDPRNLDIVRYGHLHLDFDADQADITPALLDLRTLLFKILPSYGVDPKVVPIYYSGGKGFHATIYNTLLGTEEGSNILFSIYHEMTLEFKKKLPTLDTGIYKSGMGQLYRIPNVKREEKNGVHKIPLHLSEVQEQGGLSIHDIVELAQQPRLIALPAVPESAVKQ